MVSRKSLLQTYINMFNNFFLFLLKRKKNLKSLNLPVNEDIRHLEKNMQKEVMLRILKEFFQYGQVVPKDHKLKSEYPDNVKVDEIPGFNETFYKAYRAFEKSGKSLLAGYCFVPKFK